MQFGSLNLGLARGGSGAPPLPKIAGAIARWDFSSSANLTLRPDEDLQYIEAATDLSEIGNTISEAVAESQALWVPNAKNGRGAMRHDGVGNGLRRAAFENGPVAQPMLILSVLKFPTDGRCFLTCDDNSLTARRFVLGKHSSDVRIAQIVGGQSDIPALADLAGIWVWRIDIINSTAKKIIMAAGEANMTPVAGSLYGVSIGANGSNFIMDPSDAEIGEISIWQHDPSAGEIDALKNYAKHRWGLA